MDAIFHAPGDSIDYTPSSAVDAGDVVPLGGAGGFIGIALEDIAANDLGSLRRRGIFALPKGVLSTDALAIGTLVYWNAGGAVVTTTSSTHAVAGRVSKAAAATDATVMVCIDAR